MKNAYSRCILLALIVLSMTAVLAAQSDLGSISGYVKDPSGATVPNAKVTLRNQSGLERDATTDVSGHYAVTNLPPGFYTVIIEASGFRKYETSDNKLNPSSSLAVNASLGLGATTQTVQVTAAAQTLQTQSATVQKLVTRQQMDALELNGRNPVLLSMLAPGVRGGNLSGLNFNFSSGPSNINGSRTPENLITYDGAPATRTRSNGTSLGSADEDSTQEVQVLTTDYSAEYGRSSGGQIRILTKSGTNQFHGALYEYVRNTALNANTWARNRTSATAFTAPDHYNDFGFDIGGPAYIPHHFNTDKSKIFFYFGMEWTRNYFTDSSSLTVPTMKMRSGDFSELLDPNNFIYGHTVVIKDPKTGLPFPGNMIPVQDQSPNGLGILKAYPAPNLATPLARVNWFFNAAHPQNQRKDTYAIDVNVTPNHRVQFRRLSFAFNEYQPLDGGTNETPKFFNRPNQTNSLDYVWTISPTKVNEALFTLSHDRVLIPVDAAHFLNRTTVGLNYPYIYPIGKEIETRIPTVNMSEFSRMNGGPYPSHSAGPIVDASDSFTWIKANHTMKFGFLYEFSGENDNDEINVSACSTCTNNQNGQFGFSDTASGFIRPGYVLASSGAAVANAALGLFDTYSEIGHRAYTIFRGSMWEGFGQDEWSVNPKLHINYGVRYSVIVPYHADWGNMIVFDPSFYNPSIAVAIDSKTGLITGNPTIAQLYNGMVIPGSGFPASAFGRVPEASSGAYAGLFRQGVSNHYSDIQYGDIQPRVGIAYKLSDKTVLRAGGGRFFTRLGVSDSIFLGGNPPFQPNASVSFGSVDNPGAGGARSIPLTVTTQSLAFKNPEAWAWNVTLETQTFWNSFLSVGYVARRGLHLQREADINQPTLATVLANPDVNPNALRPYKGFGSIRETDNVASSRYNSLQISWNRHFKSGLMFGLAYTYAKSNDNGSNQRDVVPDTYDTSFLWGPSEFDARNIMVIDYLYTLPIFKDQSTLAGKILGGWQIGGLNQFQTGTPCSVAGSTDYAGVGLDANYGCGVNGQYWVKKGDPKIIGKFAANGSKDPNQWFAIANPDGSPIFIQPPAGTFNTQHVRDIIYQPGFRNWNLGLFKTFAISESKGFQFRAEAYDFDNHPNLGGSSGGGVDFNPKSSTYGKVTSKGSERNIQLSLRFYF